MKTKVIHILHHCPFLTFKGDFLYGWQARYARALNQYSKEFEIESWIPAFQINRIFTLKKDGITYRAFPAIRPIIPIATNFSFSLIKELKKECQMRNVIIHLHGDRDFFVYALLSLFPRQRFVLQHHGSADERGKQVLLLAPEKLTLKHSKYFVIYRGGKQTYLTQRIGIPVEKLRYAAIGLDYTLFRPLNKMEARTGLELPQDKKYILYVGRFNQDKGLHLILHFYEKWKDKLNLGLILVGGFPQDPLWSSAKKSATHITGRIPSEIMPVYYNAADLTCLYATDLINSFGGVGVSSEESLACGTPVVSSTLRHIPFDDRMKMGRAPNNIQEFEANILQVIHNIGDFTECRETSRKYFEWSAIINETVQMYNDLLKTTS